MYGDCGEQRKKRTIAPIYMYNMYDTIHGMSRRGRFECVHSFLFVQFCVFVFVQLKWVLRLMRLSRSGPTSCLCFTVVISFLFYSGSFSMCMYSKREDSKRHLFGMVCFACATATAAAASAAVYDCACVSGCLRTNAKWSRIRKHSRNTRIRMWMKLPSCVIKSINVNEWASMPTYLVCTTNIGTVHIHICVSVCLMGMRMVFSPFGCRGFGFCLCCCCYLYIFSNM